MFSVGFVPDGDDLRAGLESELAGMELGFGLMSKPVADADGEFSRVSMGWGYWVIQGIAGRGWRRNWRC
jgi:hypothetical protein